MIKVTKPIDCTPYKVGTLHLNSSTGQKWVLTKLKIYETGFVEVWEEIREDDNLLGRFMESPKENE